jgi:uncharacterized protein (TIGR03435 family)
MRLPDAFILITSALYAAFDQTGAAPPAFDVATVKQNQSGTGRSHSSTNDGELIRTNYTLYDCVKDAYQLNYYNLTGPEWLKSERYDIVAKAPSPRERDRLMPMFQTLLAERFKLRVHRETKVMFVYALTIAKNGPKLKAANPAAESGSGASVNRSGGSLWAKKISMSGLADLLSRHLDRPARDMTGIEGLFEISTLEWAADNSDPADKPSLFDALRQQLGLTLEGKKLPVEILVVDHAEKVPAEN